MPSSRPPPRPATTRSTSSNISAASSRRRCGCSRRPPCAAAPWQRRGRSGAGICRRAPPCCSPPGSSIACRVCNHICIHNDDRKACDRLASLRGLFLTCLFADIWPEPLSFRPERFDPDSGSKLFNPHPYAYLPFGGGPRRCIGEPLALQEATVVLALLVRPGNQHRAANPTHKPCLELTMRARYGLKMHFTPRSFRCGDQRRTAPAAQACIASAQLQA